MEVPRIFDFFLPRPQGDVACWHCKGSNRGVGKEATSVFWRYKVGPKSPVTPGQKARKFMEICFRVFMNLILNIPIKNYFWPFIGGLSMSHLSTEKELDSLGCIGDKTTQLYGDFACFRGSLEA